MSIDDIRATVKAYILEEFLPGESASSIAYDTSLINGGVLDSIATVKLTAHIEDRYGIELEAHEMSTDHLDSIDIIAALVQSKLGAKK